MSRVKKMIESLNAENDFGEDQKTAVTLRLDELTLWKLDYLAKFFGMKRASFAQITMVEAVCDAMETLGFDADTQKSMFYSDKTGEDLDEVKKYIAAGLVPLSKNEVEK